jgi:ABC-type branched-subunit amino acid transport system substrate-binding protein
MAVAQRPFQLIAALPIALVVTAALYAWNQRYVSHADGKILVISVLDSGAPSTQEFGDQVSAGADDAYDQEHVYSKDLTKPIRVNVRLASAENMEFQLAKVLSRYKILGVISAGTSQTDQALTDLCRRLKVPLLLAVATNDRLLDQIKVGSADRPTDSLKQESVVFRMLPNNAQQASTLATQIRSNQGKPPQILAVFHEDNDYSDVLYDTFISNIKAQSSAVFSYYVTDGASVASAMPSLEKLNERLSAIIYIGYAEHARDMLQALSAYNITSPVYLSDGCYTEAMIATVGSLRLRNSVHLTFPVSLSKKDTIRSGFSIYGYNAYVLLSHLHDSDDSDDLRDKFNLELAQIRKGAIKYQVPAYGDEIDLPVRFSSNGEPESAEDKPETFRICTLPQTDCVGSCNIKCD